MQLDPVRSDRSPCAVVNPIACIEIVASWIHFDQAGNMAMAEGDQLDGWVSRQRGAGKRFELRGPGTAGVRDSLSGFSVADEPHHVICPIGMQATECVARRTTSDDSLEHAIPEVSMTKPVAVRQVSSSTTNLSGDRPVDEFDADFIGQESSAPRVVISPDKADPHASINKFGQGLQGSKVPTEYYRAILKPEVEQVAIDHEVTGGPAREGEELMKRSLAGFRGGAEVGIRNDHTLEFTHGQQYTEDR